MVFTGVSLLLFGQTKRLSALQSYKGPLIEQIGNLASQAKMASVMPLPNARVPVVKFAVPETATKVIPTLLSHPSSQALILAPRVNW